MRDAGSDQRAAAPDRSDRAAWLSWICAYLAASALGHLAWELAQMPFYTVWSTGSAGQIAFDALHCTAGDILIAISAVTLASLLLRACRIVHQRRFRIALATILLGLAYTAFSEWLNVQLWRSWAYSSAMPVLPELGIGLTPLLQWLVVPLGALVAAHRAYSHRIAA